MWEAVDAKGLLSAHIVERKTMLMTCLFHARGDNESKCTLAELAWKWHRQLSSHGGPEQGNENVIVK